MLTFIGLGLFDKQDISEKGLRLIRSADHVFLEGYTSRLMGATVEELEAYYNKPVRCSGGRTWSSTPGRYWTAP